MRWATRSRYSGHATDPDQGALPASALSWELIIHHCTTPSTCHIHDIQTFAGVSSGTFNAPDHDYPSYLELQLTATDAGGLKTTTSVLLQPKTVDLTFSVGAVGALTDAVESSSSVTPFTRTVIINSNNSISARHAADAGRFELSVLFVVGRRRGHAQHHGAWDREDVHRHLCQAERRTADEYGPAVGLGGAAEGRQAGEDDERHVERRNPDDVHLRVAPLRLGR